MGTRAEVHWIYDVVSPFAYLCLPRLREFTDVELRPVPVLFAGLLNHFGQRGPAEIASKRRFTYRFALWRARSQQLPMRLPPAHPFNPLAALRLIIASGQGLRAAEAVLNAVFRDGRDVASPAVLADLGRELGVADAPAAIADPAVKARLRENTEWAAALGVFGVPTVLIGREFFWGHDAIDMALEYLREPAAFEDAQMQAVERLPIGAERIPQKS